MSFSYDKLWELTGNQNLNKTQLKEKVGISSATLAKLSKNENISLQAIEKICIALDCDISEMMEFVKEDKVEKHK